MAVSKSLLVSLAVVGALGLLVGGLIGHLGTRGITGEEEEMIRAMKQMAGDGWDESDGINDRIIDLIDAEKIREGLRVISSNPHLAGSPRDDYLAEMIRDKFKEAGFDESKLVPYEVLLSFPDSANPNLITLEDARGNVVFTSKYKEVPLEENDADPNFIHAFNAYTPAGDVQTQMGNGLVYVNYGREEDFEELSRLGVDVSGTIVIARYGKVFRGNKVLNAERRGAIGVILFSDPMDVAPNGTDAKDVYPNSWWLPGSGMQRGTTYVDNGDPLTPGWPSTENAYRIKEEDAKLPKIPCQPIGYDDAKVILEKMEGMVPPEGWKGGLEGVGYKLGPQLIEGHKLHLSTHNYNSKRRSYNVIGIIKGSVEPDRYVLVGNHRDAWGYGASDPSSGTAQLLETARVFGVLLSEGWRPRRSLVFCSWGAEEYGLIGSVEWVEEHISKLQDRAVVYLNTDTCTKGSIFSARGSPLVWNAITNLTRLTPAVGEEGTLYDEWMEYHSYFNRTSPQLSTLGSGSDHAPFAFYAGIPSIDVSFGVDKRIHNISTYPYYHTGYETFYVVDKVVDPGFRITQGCSRIAALILRRFLDTPLLPYTPQDLPKAMKEGLEGVKKKNHDTILKIYPKFALLEEALDNLTVNARIFETNLEKKASKLDPLTLRSVNDQLMKMEQLFLLPEGLPGRPESRHAVFAPSQFDTYASAGFPGIIDLLYKINDLQGKEREEREEEIRKHISHLTILMQSASSYLQDLHII